MKRRIFLSHSGADIQFVRNFATRIEQAFGNELEVFCTSRPEFRLWPDGRVDLETPIGSQIKINPEHVRRYLRENLANSQLHLLLATGNSMTRGNDWVSYELQLAAEEHFAPVVVLIGGTQILLKGEDDPRLRWHTDLLDREELIKRSKWLAGNAPTLLLDSRGCSMLVRQVIPRYLGLTPSKPELVEGFEDQPW